ncbi:MAG: ATP-dependent zinc metalloprotease FtsH [SAR324 cluster bacterium]|nr:cell division protein FtsH [Pseudomonadota bacterium]MBI12934.1 cell division protein FtsH [Deltaproteobacteria bacterium]MDP6091710.1 ATP-dependent zinc metalloprotease FtsH [SAR324 cluster bacterium]MBP44678.1 cell division protein FtsH [Deltaproteobacteria bacterium]MDP6247675.1 ATP-dependent zinc metalloprotease FtsH [SAR324 cluster bacterium]
MNSMMRNIGIWLVIGLAMMVLFNMLGPRGSGSREVPFSDFISKVESGSVLEVVLRGRQVEGLTDANERFQTQIPNYPALFEILERNQVRTRVEPTDQGNIFLAILNSWLPMLLIIGIWLFFMRQIQGGGNKAMSFGKIRTQMKNKEQNPVRFTDVQGIDEAKEELTEIVEFLSAPEKFEKLGGEIPRGVLLMGDPGTGKTMLAKAIAGEAEVPFFSISGSDFVEMFVGVGASRVRDLFEQGKKNSPCIIFIDEIDAVGRSRGAGLGGGNDEREQTLNQLLVEMDGFSPNEGVIVVAATNRPDVLDPALLRPGRFDRHVVVPTPDINGREKILGSHAENVELSKDVDLRKIARGTPGFTGADLANLVNEAALWAARNNKKEVESQDFEYAKDKVMMGTERRTLLITDEEKKTTAYHEAGHALVAASIEEVDPVHKVSIIPRGRALGVTQLLPEEDRHSYNEKTLLGQIAMIMGGRAAEDLIFSRFTTGASDDLKKATDIARKMVCQWGMSTEMGPVSYTENPGQVFLGRDLQRHKGFSNESTKMIDKEVRRVLGESYQRAKQILTDNRDALENVTTKLLEQETIDGELVLQCLNKTVSEPVK